ncbi:MAG TPA: surface-adhesin E family protein [Gemmatimonadaceae bacterium]
MRSLLSAPILLASLALPAAAQSRWKEVGKTSVGNIVYVDPRSVKTAKGIITAKVRVKFIDPVKTDNGVWRSSQVTAMFDCAKASVAAKESAYYSDDAGTKVVEHSVNPQPGFGPAIGGSMTKVMLDYVCKKK